MAHPFRYICHNGEINTLRGNFNWIRAREGAIASKVLGDDLHKIWPLIYDGQSDSASFDNALELLVMGGYPLAHAMMMMIPEAWSGNPLMDEDRRAFYEYNAALMEPWDGPAAMAFTDGRQVGATLDRNGLRPARFVVTDDDLIVMASEVGVLDIPETRIVKKWRLQPGKMLLVDLDEGRIVDDKELKRTLSTQKPYREWIEQCRLRLEDMPEPAPPTPSDVPLLDRQQAFGYSQEDVKLLLTPMAQNGEEPLGSMGNDAALPVLSDRPKVFFNYFKQLFAQVTNPPIDPIREELVMSLVSFIGPRPNLLGIDVTEPAMRLEVPQPILTAENMEKIRHVELFSGGAFRSIELDICYPAAWGANGMEAALASLAAHAEDAITQGYNVLILSDRNVAKDALPIPALLATAAVHEHLVKTGLRTSAGLVVETGAAREVHHFALLAGYGAEAIHPYLALETLAEISRSIPEIDARESQKRYIKAICKGLTKVMSKMGISTYQSYCGAQIFEAVGLQKAFVDKYFTGTASNVEGIGLFEVAEESMRMHAQAFGDDPLLRAHARRRRRVPVPKPRRGAHVDAGDHRQAAARDAREQPRHVPGLRASRQRAEPAAEDVPRPVRIQDERQDAGSARGSGAGSLHRQTLRDGCDEPGLDLDRSAYDARSGDEPHRRQVEHRRGWRGPGTLSRRTAHRCLRHQGRRHGGDRAGQ